MRKIVSERKQRKFINFFAKNTNFQINETNYQKTRRKKKINIKNKCEGN